MAMMIKCNLCNRYTSDDHCDCPSPEFAYEPLATYNKLLEKYKLLEGMMQRFSEEKQIEWEHCSGPHSQYSCMDSRGDVSCDKCGYSVDSIGTMVKVETPTRTAMIAKELLAKINKK